MGLRTSIYLTDELATIWKASGLPAAEVFRRGLNTGGPVDEATLETTLRRVLDEKLATIPATQRTTSRYTADDYTSEPYLQDP